MRPVIRADKFTTFMRPFSFSLGAKAPMSLRACSDLYRDCCTLLGVHKSLAPYSRASSTIFSGVAYLTAPIIKLAL